MADLQSFLLYVCLSLAVMLALGYVLLCGDAPRHDGTFVARLHEFLLTTCPHVLTTQILPRFVGSQERAAVLTSFCATSFEKYVMPAAYHALLFGGFYVADQFLAVRLDELEVWRNDSSCPSSRFLCHQGTAIAFPPRVPRAIIPVYYVLALLSWFAVALTDPGTVCAQNQSAHNALYPADNLIFRSDGTACTTCLNPKPPRSKHCRLCDRCVARFDHHCGWMATCIGLFNIRLFILFLFLHSFMMAHASIVAAELIRAAVQRLITGNYYYANTGKPVTHFTFSIAFAAEPTLCVMTASFALASLFVGGFLLYHISLVARNITTNEQAKWETVEAVAIEHKRREGSSLWDDLRAQAVADPQYAASLPAFRDDGVPVNLYDRGPGANFAEVFAPYAFFRNRTNTFFSLSPLDAHGHESKLE